MNKLAIDTDRGHIPLGSFLAPPSRSKPQGGPGRPVTPYRQARMPATDLDPRDWRALREQAHAMLDGMLDYVEEIRERPVWQPMPDEVRDSFRRPLPAGPTPLAETYDRFVRDVLPYTIGNVHPGFMGWVHGGGTVVGMLAEMLAGGLDANLGGRDHAPIAVESQVVGWVRELLGFPATASGLFVTGTSLANLIAVLVARNAALGQEVRRTGVGEADGASLVAYTSTGVHGCIPRALDLCGLGTDALRRIPVDDRYRMDREALEEAIAEDRAAGRRPFLLAATAGTVDVGAIDPLEDLAEVASRESIWYHVDGAFGALGLLAPDVAPRLAGIERADSVAFDFHKWGQVPYDAGFVLVRDGELHRSTFASPQAYLGRAERGMAAGSPWPCDFGPDLSRGFRALKTWFTLVTYGSERLGQVVSDSCALARYLASRVEATPELELMTPVELNIVCFRYRCDDPDRVNDELVIALQESGQVAPSVTRLDGRVAIRAALFNHRTRREDVDRLVEWTVRLGREVTETVAADGQESLD